MSTPACLRLICSSDCTRGRFPYHIPPSATPLSGGAIVAFVVGAVFFLGWAALAVWIGFVWWTHTEDEHHPPPSPRGFDRDSIGRIPSRPYREGDDDECFICLSELSGVDQSLRILPPCGHTIHKDCIDDWLLRSTQCPICRTQIVVPEPAQPVQSGAEEHELEEIVIPEHEHELEEIAIPEHEQEQQLEV